jgi:hypothetical protein
MLGRSRLGAAAVSRCAAGVLARRRRWTRTVRFSGDGSLVMLHLNLLVAAGICCGRSVSSDGHALLWEIIPVM